MSDNVPAPAGTDCPPTISAFSPFCGAGGFSEALRQVVVEEFGYYLREAAINHWDSAVLSHKANHQRADQYNCKAEQLFYPEIVEELTGDPDTTIDLFLAGPECTHFSKARGGSPVAEQGRMSSWQILDMLEKIDCNAFILENVEDIISWGPTEADGTPSKDGSLFKVWLNALEEMGYNVDWTVLHADDFGDATFRKRFFIIGKKEGEVTFPEPTHSNDDPELPDKRTAAEIIDWSDTGTSIWTRDLTEPRVHSPPKDSTMVRVGEGIRRHCDPRLEPLADALAEMGRDSIRRLRKERVVPRHLAGTAAEHLDEPFLVPLPSGSLGLSSPEVELETDTPLAQMVLRQGKGAHPIDPSDRPLPAVPGRGGHSLSTVSSYPLQTTPSIPKWSHGGKTHGIDEPMPTITTARGGVFSLSVPYLTPLYNGREGQRPRTHSLDRPLMTIPARKNPAALTTPRLTPFIHDYQSKASCDRPLPTQHGKDRFGLVVPELWANGHCVALDIGYRMLKPEELMQAHSFEEDYTLVGTKEEKIKQIGNSVPVRMAKALIKHVLTDGTLPNQEQQSQQEGDNISTVPRYWRALDDARNASAESDHREISSTTAARSDD